MTDRSAGPAPPAALFHYSRDRRAERPVTHLTGYGGILQADAYAGYNALFRLRSGTGRQLTRALCWAHARRKFFELADVADAVEAAQGCAGHLADRSRSGQAHRRDLRRRTRGQR